MPQSREYQIISTIQIKDKQLVEHYYQNHETNATTNWVLNDRKGTPIYFDENDCEWLSPTFIRNKEELYGFSLVEKSRSTKLFLTRVKGKVDFKSFKAIGRFYAKDNNRCYFGPGAKIIKEDKLELFFDDTYKQEWLKSHSNTNNPAANIWNSKIAVSGEKMYWNGRLLKDVHSSLKRITSYYWADKYSVFEYDLQNLKKIDGIDRASIIYTNSSKGNAINGLVTDKNKPVHCYLSGNEPSEKYDFKTFSPLFKERRAEIDENYWWYKMEKRIQEKR